MKKLFLTAAALLTVLLLTACAGKGSPLGNENANDTSIKIPSEAAESVASAIPDTMYDHEDSQFTLTFSSSYERRLREGATLIARKTAKADDETGLMIVENTATIPDENFTEDVLRAQLMSTGGGNVTQYGTYTTMEVDGITIYSMSGLVYIREKTVAVKHYYMNVNGKTTLMTARSDKESLSSLSVYDTIVKTLKKK